MVNKKLSPIQAQVIACLLENKDSYIYKSQYYNYNRVVSKEPFEHKYGFETHELLQFNRSTFDVLLRIGAIVQFGDNKNIYKLKN